MICCRCRAELVLQQWGSALVTALAATRVSPGVVVCGPRVKVRPPAQQRSTPIRSSRRSSSPSCSNSSRPANNSLSNRSAKVRASWDARRKTTVAFVGAAAAVARGITAPIYILHYRDIYRDDKHRLLESSTNSNFNPCFYLYFPLFPICSCSLSLSLTLSFSLICNFSFPLSIPELSLSRSHPLFSLRLLPPKALELSTLPASLCTRLYCVNVLLNSRKSHVR